MADLKYDPKSQDNFLYGKKSMCLIFYTDFLVIVMRRRI